METQDMITRREAAEIAGVHMNTVRLWEQSGRVTAEKAPNGVVLIPRVEIERIAAERHDNAQTEKERIAGLETEVRMLREELERERSERATLLARILEMTGGRD